MKLYRLLAVAKKESLHIIRDWRSLTMVIAMPLMLLLLFGFALTLDVDNVPMVVWDQSKTPVSRELISRFIGSRYFSVLPDEIDNYRQVEHAIDTGRARMALVIPSDLPKLYAEHPVHVQLLVDGSNSNTAILALGYVRSVVTRFSEKIVTDVSTLRGRDVPINVIDIRNRTWYNPNNDFTNHIVPSLIAVIMMVIAALLTSLTIAREWERGTMEQLISTPIKVPELLLGKLVPYYVIGFFDVCLVALMGKLVFDVPFRGSGLLLGITSLIFLTGALSLGMLISILTKAQLPATQFAMLTTFLPSFLLSGFITPISSLPEPIQIISLLVPARYFLDILSSIYLKGVGIVVMWPEILFLCLFSSVMLGTILVSFKKRM